MSGQAGQRVAATARALAALAVLAGLIALSSLPAASTPASAEGVKGKTCSPVDVALVLDTTTSMDPAIANVKAQLEQFLSTVADASGGDYRIGLVDFGRGVSVHVPFGDRNADAVRTQIPGLLQDDDNYAKPEAWDEALATVVGTRPASAVGRISANHPGQTGDFTVPWRPEANKLVVLVTDALPAGLDDVTSAEDYERAQQAAIAAAAAGIHITTVFVPNGNQQDDAKPFLQQISALSGGRSAQTRRDGSNLTDGLSITVKACGGDADGDGLFDEWERNGIDVDGDGKIDVDLPAMGAKVDHKDLFVQVDWMLRLPGLCYPPACANDDFASAVPPNPAVLERIGDAFSQAPVTNPDRTTGIAVHFDAGYRTPTRYGIREPFRKGQQLGEQLIPPPNTKTEPYRQADAVQDFKNRWFPSERATSFTWLLYSAQLANTPTAAHEQLGLAPGTPGDVAMVSTYATRSPDLEAVTAMHEIGHTLGLRHGGVDDANYKPNYLSIMNYSWSSNDVGLRLGERTKVLDYSRLSLAPLDESKLDENKGLDPLPGTAAPDGYLVRHRCSGTLADEKIEPATGPIDWGCDGPAKTSVVSRSVSGDRDIQVLSSRNDWATISFTGGVRGGLESDSEPDTDEGFTLDAFRNGGHDHGVLVAGPSTLNVTEAAKPVTIAYQVENIGAERDTFAIDVHVSGNAAGPTSQPALVDVDAHSTATVPVLVNLGVGDDATVEFTATSRADADSLGTWRTDVSFAGRPSQPRAGRLDLAPDNPKPGATIRVTGTGFTPGAAVTLTADPPWTDPQPLVADASGSVIADLVVPADADSDATVTVTGPTGPRPAEARTPGTTPQTLSSAPATTRPARTTGTTRPSTTGTTGASRATPGTSPPGREFQALELTAVARLDKPGTATEPAPPQAPDERNVLWLAVLLAAVVAMAGAAVLLLMRRRSSGPEPDSASTTRT